MGSVVLLCCQDKRILRGFCYTAVVAKIQLAIRLVKLYRSIKQKQNRFIRFGSLSRDSRKQIVIFKITTFFNS